MRQTRQHFVEAKKVSSDHNLGEKKYYDDTNVVYSLTSSFVKLGIFFDGVSIRLSAKKTI